jgi:hypothetical protein
MVEQTFLRGKSEAESSVKSGMTGSVHQFKPTKASKRLVHSALPREFVALMHFDAILFAQILRHQTCSVELEMSWMNLICDGIR